MSNEFIVAIPARFASTRLPGKPLRLIAGRPMIAHVIDRALSAGASSVVVATDDTRIADVADESGAQVCLTRTDHVSGTDRLAEVAAKLQWGDDQIVVNLQGDEPMAPAAGISAVAELLARSTAPMATLCASIDDMETLWSPACVKVVTDHAGRALYFSRAPIPYARDDMARDPKQFPASPCLRRHIGIYAYRAGFLRQFAAMSPGRLELLESLEQLRVLEAGFTILVGNTPAPFPAGVDTEEDLARVGFLLAQQEIERG